MIRCTLGAVAAAWLVAFGGVGSALAGPISGYPNASPLDGTEKIIATQGAATVNITPTQLATYVQGSGLVSSFNARTGAVTLSNSDVVAALGFTPLNAAASSFSGSASKWATGRTISITGDFAYTSPSLDGSGNVTAAGTLPTVNANVGGFGDGTHVAAVTVNAKGLVTGVSSVAITAGNVSTTGSPSTGAVAKFSGASSITSGDFSGDCTTSGALTLACTKSGGVAFGTAAFKADGTSGSVYCLLNASCVISAAWRFNGVSPIIDGASATSRVIFFDTSTSKRADTGLTNTAESGSNVGSNWCVNTYDDTGAFNFQPLCAYRADGIVQVSNGLAIGSSKHLLISASAPTISSGFGTGASIVASNGTEAFQINVGTGGSATSGVIGLPTANTGWVCQVVDITTESTTVFLTKQTASSATTATVGNFNTSASAAAWVASDKLNVSCHGY